MFRTNLSTPAFIVLATAVFAACGEDLVLPADPNELRDLRIAVVDGAGQKGTVGEPLPEPVVVEVRTPEGASVPGRQVTFGARDAGAGTATPDRATTGADGRASARWVLGTVSGSQSLEARVVNPEPDTDAVVTIEAAAGAASPDTVFAEGATSFLARRGRQLKDPIVVRLQDRYGNPVPGATVCCTLLDGQGELSAPASPTDGDGRASVRWTLGSDRGQQRLSAGADGAGGSPVVFTATAI